MTNRLPWRKKGTEFDMLFLIVVIMIFIFAGVLLYPVLNKFDAAYGNASESAIPNASKTMMHTTANSWPQVIDNGFLIILLIGTVFIIASSTMIDTNPAFFALSFIALLLILFVGFLLANVFSGFVDAVSDGGKFQIINFIMSRLGLYIVVLGGAILIVLYGKSRVSG